MTVTYTQMGNYQIPNLMLPQRKIVLNSYGKARKKFLKETHPAIYRYQLTQGTLNSHLNEIQEQAQQMEEQIITQMAKAQGVTEKLKQTNMMTWVGLMNNIKNSARETVLNELIYTM